ncbi:MarR family transcriptional regulator [Paenibacillus thiaminolyticus]|uniref:MarR family winged helix-turn-helix transcriptional regulator n=1 Tax=Paenibacillus thiaminolyticus TaxID=49283 RepID=UPI001F0F2A7C|nr:MarR family transcriptional regulator [Paenibacillus thiaminolyticus]WCR28816.1 MarR family transcriptional regulator [Paenibacillus thiaminolyticus]
MTEENRLFHSIGFVMGMTYRKVSTLFHHRLKEYDITPEQWTILYQISRADGLIQRDIAERSGKDKPTTTRILDHLEAKGFVFKTPGEHDRRSFLVRITERGKALIEHTSPIEQQMIHDIKQCMSEDEYDLLIELLLRVNSHVNELPDRE